MIGCLVLLLIFLCTFAVSWCVLVEQGRAKITHVNTFIIHLDLYLSVGSISNVIIFNVNFFCSEFIDPNAASMVNLSAKAKAEAEKDLLNPSRYSFSHAQVNNYFL